MYKSKWLTVVCVLACLCGQAAPLYAQKNLSAFFKKFLAPRKTPGTPLVPAFDLSKSVPSLDPIIFSKTSSLAGLTAVAPLFAPNFSIVSPRPLTPPPPEIRHAVFTLQRSPQTHGKGSAVAIKIDGKVWGVTARHILNDIGRSPFMEVQLPSGEKKLFQVYAWKEGNLRGADVALFQIPSQAAALLTPLEADYELPPADSTVQSAGFSRGIFSWFNRVTVLFSSEHRILARYDDLPVRNGYCGSPLLRNGKVVGIFVGITDSETAQQAEWYQYVAPSFKTPINSFTSIVPIAWVRRLTLDNQSPAAPRGVVLKLLGNPITVLHPNESIFAIQQLRDGKLVRTVYAYPFLDYQHLERFFDIHSEDLIRIVIRKESSLSSKQVEFWYDWDVSSRSLSRTKKGTV